MTDIANLRFAIDSSGLKSGQKELKNIGKESDSASRKVSGLGRRFVQLAASAAAIAGVTVGLRNSIQTISQFEASMSSVRAITRSTDEQMQQLEMTARRLGATTSFSASQAAEAIQFLGMAGFDTVSIMQAMPDTLALARAGALDLGSAADIASNALSGFGLQASEMGMVADTLAATSSRSNTSVMQLGDALSYAAPLANSLGISIREVSAAVGTLSDAGLQGSRAGTGLSGVMRQLTNVTTDGQAVLTQYGLTMQNVSLESNSLAEVIDTLGGAGLAAADVMRLFGAEAGVAAQILLASGDRVSGLTSELEGATGAAQEMADAMGDNLAGDFLTLQSAASELVLSLNDFLGTSDRLRGMVQGVTGVTQEFAAVLASGQIEYYLQAISTEFEYLWRDAEQAIDLISILIKDAGEFWGQSGVDAVGFIRDAFTNMPTNIKTMVRIATVELAVLVDRAKAYGEAIKNSLDPRGWFDGEGMADFLAAENERIDQIRLDAITAILNERDEAIAASAERRRVILADGAAMRAEWEDQRSAMGELGSIAQEVLSDLATGSSEAAAATSDLTGDIESLRSALGTDMENAMATYLQRLELIEQAEQEGAIGAAAANDLRLRSFQDYQEQQTAILDKESKERSRIEQEELDQRKKMVSMTASIVSDAAGQAAQWASVIGDAYGKNSSEYRAALKNQRNFAIASIAINTAMAAAAAMAPPPIGLGPVAGLPYAIAIGAMGIGSAALNIAQTEMAINDSYKQRAMGGQVSAGDQVLVGERGPELLTMGASGNITPNHQMGGQGGVNVTNVFQISAGVEGTVRKEIEQAVPMITEMSKRAVEAAINSGGSLSRATGRRT